MGKMYEKPWCIDIMSIFMQKYARATKSAMKSLELEEDDIIELLVQKRWSAWESFKEYVKILDSLIKNHALFTSSEIVRYFYKNLTPKAKKEWKMVKKSIDKENQLTLNY